MKKLILIISLLTFIMIAQSIQAQTPPPPNNGATNSGGTTPVGGGAPVGSGLAFMLALGLTYSAKNIGLKQLYKNVNDKKNN